jgi:hypothetical protein
MEQPGLHQRHRDENGEISRKHGNTLISTLRKRGTAITLPPGAASKKSSAKYFTGSMRIPSAN